MKLVEEVYTVRPGGRTPRGVRGLKRKRVAEAAL